MDFNVVKVLEIEPGAELDGTVFDQWVKIAYKDNNLSLFDMDMLAPEDSVGDHHEIKVGAMFTELEAGVDYPPMANGNRFCGEVVSVIDGDGLYEHVVDIDGIKVILDDHEKHVVGTMLRFKARLDLLEIRGSTGGWKDV